MKINPNYADPWNNTGTILSDSGKYDEAIRCLDKALKIEPHNADIFYDRAAYKVKKRDIDNGLADLKKAIEIDKEKYIELAKQDRDFESIRNNERFEKLITIT